MNSKYLFSVWFVLQLALLPWGSLAAQENVVRRTTLVVHDIEASIDFYRTVLGFELWLDVPGEVNESSLPSHAEIGHSSRFVIMKGAHPWVGMVGLLQYGDSVDSPQAPERLSPGDAILMIETDDVAVIHQRMQEAGTTVLRPPKTTLVTGADGNSWQATFLFAFDPDGHLLELNQRVAADSADSLSATDGSESGDVQLRRQFVDYRYGQLHVRQARPLKSAASEPTLLLFHQTPLSGRLYDEVLPLLAHNRVVYAVDTPGYGESDPPPAPLSIEEYAASIADFVNTIPGQVDVLGYHTGVLLSMELARTLPEKVRRVVLVSVPLFSDEVRSNYKANREPIDAEGQYLADMWASSLKSRSEGQSVERIAQIVAEKQRAGIRSWWSGPAIFNYDTRTRLSEINQLVLVMRPADTLKGGTTEATSLLKHAEMLDLPDFEYGFFDTHPQLIASQVLEFLER